MRSDICAALAVGAGLSLAAPAPEDSTRTHLLHARNIVDNIAGSYDFVVVGGGLAGLVLGARLSEDANHTVLVLEAGETGDDFRDQIDIPGNTYYNSLWPTPLNWAFQTTVQAGANNSSLVWPRGKVLGGSSAINGLYMTRPGAIEINAWQDMLGDMDGAENWSWDSLYAAMKKSETYTPPDSAVVQEAAITWNASNHGTTGPVHMSYPGYTFPQVGQWSTAMENVGVAESSNTYGGENWGAYVATSCINPANWTRSDSRAAYLDPLSPRPNYAVLANAQVTRILFNSSSPATNLTANAVEYTLDGGQTKLTVNVSKEVILAGGSVGSPWVLQNSGVGPKDVLAAAGVPLLSELPGVGQHLQDHLSVNVQWSTDQPTSGSIYASNNGEQNDPVFLSYVNDAIAYVNATTFFGSGLSTFQSSIVGSIDEYIPAEISDATVLAGYKAIYNTTVNKILTSPIGQIEFLFANNAAGSIRITTSIQRPYSQGQIYITSSNPVDYPAINPNYLSHPADVTILREGLKFARRVGETNPLAGNMLAEMAPGPAVQTDEEWEDWLRGQGSTEFHPSSTCAMLPLDQGGVVDANLRVYGLANVRVADASVPPTVFSAHLMSSTYGIAEQASTMIRAFHNGLPATASGSSTSNTTNTASGTKSGESPSGTAAAEAHTSNSSSTSHMSRNVGIGVGIAVGAIALAALLWFCIGSRRRRRNQPSRMDDDASAIALEKSELVEGRGRGASFKYAAVGQQAGGGIGMGGLSPAGKKQPMVKVVGRMPGPSENSSRVDLLEH